MDTSVSDVSMTDFTESKKGLRKRKRKLAPLEFIEDPLDASFNSPDRPCAAQNPVGAPTVNALDLNNSWLSVDKFGKVTLRKRMSRKPDKANVITCSKSDCVNPLHVHKGGIARRIDISDNDSDLLLSINEVVDLSQVADNAVMTSALSVSEDSGRGNIEIPKSTEDCNSSKDVSPAESPVFERVGYSQCKSAKTKRKARANLQSKPESFFSVISNKENVDSLKRKVLFESPRTPINPVSKRRTGKILDTPENRFVQVYVENTPEHLVGVGMVTRRLRRLLGHTVPESLGQP